MGAWQAGPVTTLSSPTMHSEPTDRPALLVGHSPHLTTGNWATPPWQQLGEALGKWQPACLVMLSSAQGPASPLPQAGLQVRSGCWDSGLVGGRGSGPCIGVVVVSSGKNPQCSPLNLCSNALRGDGLDTLTPLQGAWLKVSGPSNDDPLGGWDEGLPGLLWSP